MSIIITSRYDNVAKTLHWVIALAIIVMLGLGWIMGELQGSQKFAAFQIHKSIGITIMLLSLCRLSWRLSHRFPALPETMNKWEKIAAQLTHILFYVIMIGMPFTGWVIVSTSPLNVPTLLYGFIPWPHLPILPTLENKKAIGHFFGGVHGFLAYTTALLVVLHAGAAWFHHHIKRDDVLLRMAPGFMAKWLNNRH